MTAVGAVRGSDMRKQLADDEVANAHAMRRGETADVAVRLSVCGVPIPMGSSEYSRLRGGIAAGMSVHSGKIASPSASMLASLHGHQITSWPASDPSGAARP